MEYEELRQGLEAAFVDWNTSSNLAYKPQFISNDYRVAGIDRCGLFIIPKLRAGITGIV